MLDHNGFKESLYMEMKTLQGIKKIVEERLREAPEGSLHVLARKKGKTPQFYQYVSREKRKYIPKNQNHVITGLAQKEYDYKLLKLIYDRLAAGMKMLDAYNNSSEIIYEEILDEKKILISPCILPDSMFIDNWYAAHTGGMNTYPIPGELYSERGEKVRSKSEMILADLFHRYHIPYVYEPQLTLKSGRVVYPDFILLNVRLRKTYIYEHFGMMNDAEYAEKAYEKIQEYEISDYLPGETLLFSMESQKSSLNVKVVEKLIKKFLI